ncbi:prostate-associated microseminoprotein [Trichechus manatus latirostris]|uniref:Beta-microseminoprotein n=1 Tax=Trichechus manatus latirostris TaxID=127582 RepID=A0A2Y9QIQ7_TRIMA|nr:prostate-associated microseminoprotein [Trichechus manatus latirostris]
MRQEPKGEREKVKERSKEKPRRQKPRSVQEGCAAGMALKMLWPGQAKGTLGSQGIICLVMSLLLQHPGVHSKCYFQAQGKAGGGVRKGQGAEGVGVKGLVMILCWNGIIPKLLPTLKQKRKTKYGGLCSYSLPPRSERNLSASTTPTYTNISHSSLAPCHYEGKYFTLGESWLRKDCFHCTCLHPVGVGCCDTSQHPIDFPAGCEVHQEAGTCQFSLVQKSDPRLPCKGGGPNPEWGSANTPDPGAPAPHSS